MSDELKKSRQTHGYVPWLLYIIAFVELCERFAHYGKTVVCTFNNTAQRKEIMLTGMPVSNYVNGSLPPGSKTGSAGTDGQTGALGYGSQASTALILFNAFWAYVMSMVGGYMADT